MACASCGGGRQLTPNIQKQQLQTKGHQSTNNIRIPSTQSSGSGFTQTSNPNKPRSVRTKV